MHHLMAAHSQIRLRELFPEARTFHNEEIVVNSCSSDWRECQTGDVFVAVERNESDGHDFVNEAIESGAVAVIAERLVPCSVPVLVVDDAREAFARLCHAIAGNPTSKVKTIGVIGSQGKSSVCRLLEAIFAYRRQRVAVVTDYNWFGRPTEQNWETPNATPPVLATGFSDAVSCGFQYALIEISSIGLAQRLWTGVELDVLVVNQARADHLAYHGSPTNHFRALQRAVDLLKPEGMGVFNADDQGARALLDNFAQPGLTFGLDDRAEITATIIESTPYEQTFMINAGSDSVTITTACVGTHHIYNCLAATTVALSLGFDLPSIGAGLETIQRIPGQCERVQHNHSFELFVDSSRSPDQLRSTLQALRRTTRGQLYCIFDVPADGDKSSRAWIGSVLEKGAHHAAIAATGSPGETPLQVIHDVLDGYKNVGRDLVSPDFPKGLAWAMQQARPGDCVVAISRRLGQSIDPILNISHLQMICEQTAAEISPVNNEEPTYPNLRLRRA